MQGRVEGCRERDARLAIRRRCFRWYTHRKFSSAVVASSKLPNTSRENLPVFFTGNVSPCSLVTGSSWTADFTFTVSNRRSSKTTAHREAIACMHTHRLQLRPARPHRRSPGPPNPSSPYGRVDCAPPPPPRPVPSSRPRSSREPCSCSRTERPPASTQTSTRERNGHISPMLQERGESASLQDLASGKRTASLFHIDVSGKLEGAPALQHGGVGPAKQNAVVSRMC